RCPPARVRIRRDRAQRRAKISLPSALEILAPPAREVALPSDREVKLPPARERPAPCAQEVALSSARSAPAPKGDARRAQLAVPCARRGRCAGPPMDALRCADDASTNGGNRRTMPRRILPPLPAARLDQISIRRPHWKERRSTRRRQQGW